MSKTGTVITSADVHTYFTSLSNWGRWGTDDQAGTLNLITAEVRRQAAGCVKHGRAIGCARTLSPVRTPLNPQPILHHMTVSGESASPTGFSAAADWIGMDFHGYSITHIDALSHLFWNGRMYNDRPAGLVKTASGARVGSVELARDGIVSRGVLLDIPRFRGVPFLDLGEGVDGEELIRCADAQAVSVRPGDILLVRVGRDERAAQLGPSVPEEDGSPGLHASALPVLREWDIAVLGADATNDRMPSGFDDIGVPVHSVGIVAMGLWLLDNAYLETLAEVCAEYEQWTFLMSIAALPVKNSTGSPVTPVAVL